MEITKTNPGELNGNQVSVHVSIDDLLQQLSDMERSGVSLQVRNSRVFVVGVSFGWTLEQQAVAAVYEALEKRMPTGVDAEDVVDIIYDEDDHDCESMEFFGGIVQAIPLTFESKAGYDFKLVFD